MKNAEVRFAEFDHNAVSGMCEMRLRTSAGKIMGRIHIPRNVIKSAFGWLLSNDAPNISLRLGGLNNDKSN